MRRCVLGLLLPLFLGCAGKNVVAGVEKSKAEQLKAEVPSWCEAVCKRVDACGQSQDCGCASGQECTCGSGNDCPASCQGVMSAFTKGDETCASIGQRFKSCIDGASCAQLFDDRTCQLTDDEQATCPKSGSDEPPSTTGTGSSGGPVYTGSSTAGSANIGSGGASNSGGSSMDPGTAAAPSFGGTSAGGSSPGPEVTCQGSYGSGGGTSGSPSSTQVICEEGRRDCTDGHDYSWLCAKSSDGKSGCSCFVDSDVTGGFDPGSGCPDLALVNAGCHFNLTQ